VPQDDIMYESMTVYQNLYFSAMLRLPCDMAYSQKIGIIEDVIAIFDLQGIRNSVVGG
jgi:ABC-type multidrug transport system ATPase subunit